MFSESLTVRILGDSSSLRQELNAALSQLGTFEERVQSISTVARQLGNSFGSLTRAFVPLQTVSKLISQITGQIRTLSQTPITLNVQPAISAIRQLAQAIDSIIARLRAISMGPMPSGPSGPVTTAPSGGTTTKFAQGGLVTGPSGIDRVPAMLTAGEFVLNQQAVAHLGSSLLNAVNASPGSNSSRQLTSAAVSSPQTNNHFGGININVRETADINAVVRDLRLQGIQLRNRRG
ncbi:MAG: hypothetical protein R3C01_07585 [Planctomycetaceae bacterium]